MAAKLNFEFSLNLANKGEFVDVPTLGIDAVSFEGLDTADWGSAVVEIQEVVGGYGSRGRSYGSPKTISVSGVDIQQDIATNTTEFIRARVLTPDATKMYGRLIAVGEGKD